MPFPQSQIETDGGKSLDFSNYPYIIYGMGLPDLFICLCISVLFTISLILHVEMERAILCQCLELTVG
jgi:hypothetical protein